WFPLMRGAASHIDRWLALVKRVPSRRRQGDLLKIALVFAEPANALDKWRQPLKECAVEVSQVILEWTADARREAEIEALAKTLLRQAKRRFAELTAEDAGMISGQ